MGVWGVCATNRKAKGGQNGDFCKVHSPNPSIDYAAKPPNDPCIVSSTIILCFSCSIRREEVVETGGIRLRFLESKGCPLLSTFELYNIDAVTGK
jgi:hypothetical protein